MKAAPQVKRAVQRQLSYSEEEEEEFSLSEEEEEEEEEEEVEPMVVESPKVKVQPQQQKQAAKPKMAVKPQVQQQSKPSEAKKAAAPKAQKEVSYEEVSEVLEALGFVFKPRHLKSMARHYKKLYARLVELLKPRLKFTSHATPVGRLIYFVPGPDPLAGGGWGGENEGYYAVGDFVSVINNESVVILPAYDCAKKLILADLTSKLVVEGQPPPSKNRDDQLYQLIKRGFVETEVPSLESKMSECVFVDEKNKRAYWLNTQEGKKALGPVVNAQNIKKLTQEALDKEAPKLEALRDELLALFGEYAAEARADEASGKNKRKIDEEEEEEAAPPIEKKQRTESGAVAKKATTPPKPVPKATTQAMEVERKSTAKPSTTTTTTKKPPSPAPTTTTKKPPVQPSKVTTITTVQIGALSPDARDRIQKMGSTEIRAMLSKVEEAAVSTDSALHEVAWYKKYL